MTSRNLTMALAVLITTISSVTLLPVLTAQSGQQTFPSPGVACESLFKAVQSNDEQAIARILSNQPNLLGAGDPEQDKSDRSLFVRKYQEMHRLHRGPDGVVVLYVGAENWPFPLPLVEMAGAWRFDSEAGAKEITLRRVGENEESAIDVCRQFATGALGQDEPLNQLTDPAKPPVLFHGYYFRVLSPSAPGKAVLLAYPAEYRSSGVMTFFVTRGSIVYEKDLGANHSPDAARIQTLSKDALACRGVVLEYCVERVPNRPGLVSGQQSFLSLFAHTL